MIREKEKQLLNIIIRLELFNPYDKTDGIYKSNYNLELKEFREEVESNLWLLSEKKEKIYLDTLLYKLSDWTEPNETQTDSKTKRLRNIQAKRVRNIQAMNNLITEAREVIYRLCVFFKIKSVAVKEVKRISKFQVASVALAIAILRAHGHVTTETAMRKKFGELYAGTTASIYTSTIKNKFQKLPAESTTFAFKQHEKITSDRLLQARRIIVAENNCSVCLKKIKEYETKFL